MALWEFKKGLEILAFLLGVKAETDAKRRKVYANFILDGSTKSDSESLGMILKIARAMFGVSLRPGRALLTRCLCFSRRCFGKAVATSISLGTYVRVFCNRYPRHQR